MGAPEEGAQTCHQTPPRGFVMASGVVLPDERGGTATAERASPAGQSPVATGGASSRSELPNREAAGGDVGFSDFRIVGEPGDRVPTFGVTRLPRTER